MKKQTNEPTRVLQVVAAMNRGGLETMLMNYYRNIDRDKVQFDFIVHRADKGDYDDEIMALGGKIFHFSPIALGKIGKYRNDLRDFFWAHPEYQIVHAHLDSLSALPLSVAKSAGVPKRIAHSHTSSFDRDVKYFIRNTTKKLIKYYATDLVGCSTDAVKFMFGKKIKAYRIINNAVDVDKFSYNAAKRKAMRTSLGVEDRYVLGHVGRFSFPKNHDFLIEVFKKVHDRNNDAVLVLVGSGENEARIKRRVADLHLEKFVMFLGLRPDISDLMQAMDIFVMPSKYEGLPVVSIEAQMSGLNCFFSDVITRDISITENTSFLSLLRSPEEWAKEIVGKKSNVSQRSRLHTNQNYVGFDIIQEVKKIEAMYEDFANN